MKLEDAVLFVNKKNQKNFGTWFMGDVANNAHEPA